MSGSNSIIFFGNERLATGVHTDVLTLKSLIKAGYNVAAVVSNYEPAQSRSARRLEIKAVAEQHNIPVLLPAKPIEIIDQLRSYDATIGILVAYGKIVPQQIIDIFPKGIVNIHPSLLPQDRGPTPIEHAILKGMQTTGVSIMQLIQKMDAGPVYAQRKMHLTGSESKQALADTLLRLGSALLLDCLPQIISGTLAPAPQDESQATYTTLLAKDAGIIDWRKPAHLIEREIRAFSEWPKSRTTLAGKEVVIMAAHTVDEAGKPGQVNVQQKELIICTGEKALAIDRLKPAGKNKMTGTEFIRGYPINSKSR